MKRSFFQYVSLNVLGALGLSGYILADTLFVAHRLGTDGLAALNLAISVFGLINGLGLMLGIGGATRYAICRTQGDGVRADRAFSRALACGGTLGGLLALAGLLWAVPLARLLGAEGAILPMCSVYLRTVLLFAPCFLLNHILTAFVRNDGNPKLAMAAMLLGSLSNIVLDYVFLYPMDMGIFGAALATGIAPVVGLCVSSLHILTRRSRFRLRPFRPALRPLADLAGLGSAAFLNECSSGLVLVVFNLLTLRLAGTLGVAAYGIVANLALMALALFTGVNQGVQPLVSLAHGRGDAAGVRTLCRMALGLALCAGAVVSFGRPSPGPFREDGLYRFSRNPMYVSYFVYFAGCVLLTRSRLLAALVLLFQLSEHWIILAEERWCREQFGAPYEAYRKRVRRYL